ncbi:ferredoxin [bacterium]|nr:ferredoxin [bacterium]
MTSVDSKFAELDELLKKKTVRSREDPRDKSSAEKKITSNLKAIPSLPEIKAETDEKKLTAFWIKLRSFYRTAQGGGIKDSQLFPALLSDYRDMLHVRYDYPVWIPDEAGMAENDAAVLSLTELLHNAVKTFAPSAQDAKILKDNIGRLELIVRESIDASSASVSFSDVMWPALQKLETQLKIKGQDGKVFSEDVHKIKSALPQSGKLVTFSHEAPFLLLSAAIRCQFQRSYQKIKADAVALRNKLDEMLRIENKKKPDANAPETLKGSYGYGASFINFDKFSSVIPESSSEMMTPQRLTRIEKIVTILRNIDSYFKYDSAAVIAEDLSGSIAGDWSDLFPHSNILIADKRIISSEAQNAFETHMKSMSEWLSAFRIARLEVEGKYIPDIHDAYFSNFDWRAFTEDEMALCPPVLLITPAEELILHNLTEFSRLLASHKPIKTIVIKSDAEIIHSVKSMAQDYFSFPQELGALAVSHRNAYVFQSTTIHPKGLYEGYMEGISGFSPALFYILSPRDESGRNTYVWAGAALESRAFPEFTYDQRRGVQWGSRFNVEKNPQADQDWPIYELSFITNRDQKSVISVPFSFADFASQDVFFAEHFFDVPPQYWSDDLVLFADYLKMEPTEAYSKIPFIWMTDTQHKLHKVATTHFLILYGQERLDFWHFIQEFGGINSYHVDRAVEKARQMLLEEKAKEIAALNEAHEAEIEIVKKSTAREAMEKLSGILLELDTLEVKPAVKISTAVTVVEPAAQKTAEPQAPETVVEEETVSTEPWLDTIRCTSCNECINVNPNLFKYNGSKQAYIADAKSGTYAQMVKAAEKCPAKCIHPGMPLNASEEGLDDLIKRAAAFN